MLDISACDPRAAEAQLLLDRLSATLRSITGSSGRGSFDPADVAVPGALFVLARDPDRVAVGCGAYRPLAAGVAELKRMYAVPGQRGVGAAILAFLEARAREDGYERLWLETRLVNARAVRFYERHGYVRIPNFGKYAGRDEAACFGKPLRSG